MSHTSTTTYRRDIHLKGNPPLPQANGCIRTHNDIPTKQCNYSTASQLPGRSIIAHYHPASSVHSHYSFNACRRCYRLRYRIDPIPNRIRPSTRRRNHKAAIAALATHIKTTTSSFSDRSASQSRASSNSRVFPRTTAPERAITPDIMPSRLDAPVLTVDVGLIHKVDTRNVENLFSMWTGEHCLRWHRVGNSKY